MLFLLFTQTDIFPRLAPKVQHYCYVRNFDPYSLQANGRHLDLSNRKNINITLSIAYLRICNLFLYIFFKAFTDIMSLYLGRLILKQSTVYPLTIQTHPWSKILSYNEFQLHCFPQGPHRPPPPSKSANANKSGRSLRTCLDTSKVREVYFEFTCFHFDYGRLYGNGTLVKVFLGGKGLFRHFFLVLDQFQ